MIKENGHQMHGHDSDSAPVLITAVGIAMRMRETHHSVNR